MTEKRLYHKVAREILDMIESGAYPPGTRLPGERELAQRFNVSRVVVREAEISLEAVGRLEIKVGSGAYVKDSSPINGFSLPTVSAFELTHTRLLFESECAAIAATMITDEKIEELEETVERMANADEDSIDGEIADRDFHLLIAKATGNEANIFFLEMLWRMRNEISAVKKVYSAICHEDGSQRVAEHSEVLKAIRNRDSKAARAAMREHFSRLLEALLDVTEQQAIADAIRKSQENRERFLQSGVVA